MKLNIFLPKLSGNTYIKPCYKQYDLWPHGEMFLFNMLVMTCRKEEELGFSRAFFINWSGFFIIRWNWNWKRFICYILPVYKNKIGFSGRNFCFCYTSILVYVLCAVIYDTVYRPFFCNITAESFANLWLAKVWASTIIDPSSHQNVKCFLPVRK